MLIGWLCCFTHAQAQQRLSLAGEWRLRLDSLNKGKDEQWFLQSFRQAVKLPGTLDDAGIGHQPTVDTSVMNKEVMAGLSRKHRYIGAAWYEKEILVSKNMEHAQLFLERVIWRSDCWLDGQYRGAQESLIAPHIFELGTLKPGKHRIVLRIDNSLQHDISYNNFAHAYTDATQIIWNGVIGDISLKGQSAVAIGDMQLYPDRAAQKVHASLSLRPTGTAPPSMQLQTIVMDGNQLVARQSKTVTTADAIASDIYLKNIKPWNEFNPHVYTFKAILTDAAGKILDQRESTFGFRELQSAESQLRLNGDPVFLRGTLECDIFPLTGHPPMEDAGWRKLFLAAKSYGLNHLRFHSWCPPAAAFRMADSLGFYLQIELPLWSLTVGKDTATLRFLEVEAQRIISAYGNHPSFCFWSMGNELEGDFDWLQGMVRRLKQQDPRRLYTTTSFSFQQGRGRWPEQPDDFYVTQYTKNGWVRGQGIFNTQSPDFKTDYRQAVNGVPVPLLIHEVGQYAVYPDMQEISRYTGVLDPLNFKAVRNDLRKKHLLPLAPEFLKASGQLALLLYKEEIERALKTEGVSGFQLLDLHDFPGQGTALVGLLNAFWESKGIVAPAAFRQFCGPVTPLLRFEKAVYTNTETFTATASVANYSGKSLSIKPVWDLRDESGKVWLSGKLPAQNLSQGNGNTLGNISIDLHVFSVARQLTLRLRVQPGYENEWRIWVYPAKQPQEQFATLFTTSVDEAVAAARQGKAVVLNPDTAQIRGVEGRFAQVFWSPVHFPNQPGTMGLLCDTAHPALKGFPTAFHTDWQWWDLVTFSKTMILDSIPAAPTPIVRVVDNFFKNRNMADVVEYRVGKGKVLICSMDLHHDLERRPVAVQLKQSLMRYASGTQFKPALELTEAQLRSLFK